MRQAQKRLLPDFTTPARSNWTSPGGTGPFTSENVHGTKNVGVTGELADAFLALQLAPDKGLDHGPALAVFVLHRWGLEEIG